MYYLLIAILYPLSLLPPGILYLLSDTVYVLLYYVTGYRKDVVRDNLVNAFPEKNAKEIEQIMRRFYRSFCDQWIETVKLLSISEYELNKRVKGNWEEFQALDAEGKNTYAMLGHTFNWEWANVACQYNCAQQFAGVYLPVTNKAFDRLMLRIRSRSGSWLISMKAKKSAFQRLNTVRYIVGLMADQNPSVTEVATWLPFMHREAPFFRGAEAMARRAKAAVVFAGIKKTKRGYYEIQLHRFCSDASQVEQGEILQAYVKFIEQQLHDQPENWLWSHRRWKHVKK